MKKEKKYKDQEKLEKLSMYYFYILGSFKANKLKIKVKDLGKKQGYKII